MNASSWDVFDGIVEHRRAIRAFSRATVREDDMNDVLDAALLAPTSSNLQPFELVWVRSTLERHRLIEDCMSQPAAMSASELVVCIARWDRCDEARRAMAETAVRLRASPGTRLYLEHLARWSYDLGPASLYARARGLIAAPLRLVLTLPRGPLTHEDVRTWATKSAALVCEAFMLAASAKGLDTCPMEGLDPLRVGRLCGLDARLWKRTWDVTMVIAVGYRDPRIVVPERWRRSRASLVREI